MRWVSYDKVGGLYSGKLGIRSEARASDLRSYPGLWWKRIKLHLYEGTKVSTLRGPAQLADLQGALCVTHLYTMNPFFLPNGTNYEDNKCARALLIK